MTESLFASLDEREMLEYLCRVLQPLDAKISHSLYVGTEQQMRADLSYLRGLLAEARAAIEAALLVEPGAGSRTVGSGRTVGTNPGSTSRVWRRIRYYWPRAQGRKRAEMAARQTYAAAGLERSPRRTWWLS